MFKSYSYKQASDLINYSNKWKQQRTEAVVRQCSVKKAFLKVLQNSQEKTCGEVNIWQSCRHKAYNFTQVFLYEFWIFE